MNRNVEKNPDKLSHILEAKKIGSLDSTPKLAIKKETDRHYNIESRS